MNETRFVVVRHGETAWNAQSRIQGHLDSPLNEEGLAQALLVGERLAREPFDRLYCSDLGRVMQTVQPLVDRTGRQPVLTHHLRERHLGVFQGLTGAECERAFPEDYARFHARDPDHAVPGGESIRQVYRRVAGFFDELAVRDAGHYVVVATHGGIPDALYRHVTGTPLDRRRDFPIYNASLNWLRFAHGRWLLDQWSDISHLTRDAALDDF
jgi:2,3-bisphosphoglycerate-dependent phosphoglycerate mutase